MKVRVKTTATVLALFAAIAGTSSFAQTNVNYTAGDMLIGFQVTTSGSTGYGQNFLLNIGSAAAYNNGTMPLGFDSPIANIGTVLSSTYGSGWETRSDLSWGAAALRQNIPNLGSNEPIIDGDGRGVMYVSRQSTGIQQSNPWEGVARRPSSLMSGSMIGLFVGNDGGFNQQIAVDGTNGLGAVVAGGDNSWSSLAPATGSSFGILSGSINGSVNFSVDGFSYLDVYRIAPDGTTPSWVVTLAIDNVGNVYAVPEPSTYAALIGAAGLALVVARRVRRNKVAA